MLNTQRCTLLAAGFALCGTLMFNIALAGPQNGKMPAYPQIEGKDLKALVAYLGSFKK